MLYCALLGSVVSDDRALASDLLSKRESIAHRHSSASSRRNVMKDITPFVFVASLAGLGLSAGASDATEPADGNGRGGSASGGANAGTAGASLGGANSGGAASGGGGAATAGSAGTPSGGTGGASGGTGGASGGT